MRFESLVGQPHVVRTLQHALDSGRLHHAYLFTGPRGVGKTTLARLLVRCLNCAQGVTSNPCGKCGACTSIGAGQFPDLLEIDAASHTGIDDIREILDNVPYAPALGRFKVYLIDEVHMLSRSSFNALLKTLEEPPEHVKFLLATTAPKQIPITVLSRCLQFNLRLLSVDTIAKCLRTLLRAEKIAADDQAITMIARAANGSMRDCLSLADHAISYGAGALQANEVRAMLGTPDHDLLGKLMTALIAHDGRELMALANEYLCHTPDVDNLLAGLAALLHNVSLAQLVNDVLPADLPEKALCERLAKQISPRTVQIYYQALLTGRRDLPIAPDEQIGFEMTLLRMLALRPLVEPGNEQLDEQAPDNGVGKSTNPAGQAPLAARVPNAKGASGTGNRGLSRRQNGRVATPESPDAPDNEQLDEQAPDNGVGKSTNPAGQAPLAARVPDAKGASGIGNRGLSRRENGRVATPESPDAPDAENQQARPPNNPGAMTVTAAAGGELCRKWLQLIENSGLDGAARQILDNCELISWQNDRIQLRLDDKKAAYRRTADSNLGTMRDALCGSTGRQLEVAIEMGKVHWTPAMEHARLEHDRLQLARKRIRQDPFVRKLLQTFAVPFDQIHIQPLPDAAGETL